ncbi:MAG TPA: plastocyanin/azurin family copper-binding protein [Solirubrobacterales bacterium]|nr:plastocyanin/azurin family copper-binding protein [Solirubrobacterales bacterium]
MGPPRRGEARRRHGGRLLLIAVVALGALQSTAIGAADEATVEPAETPAGFAWKPTAVTATAGASVAFRNPGAVTPHGVHWTAGPETPSCSGVPVDAFGTSWSGSCTFAQAGTYPFVCTVHPEEMKGTITVASGEATPSPTPAPGSGQAPPASPPVEALRLPGRQRGSAVRGSITVSPSALGGRLTVELKARRASLGGQDKGLVRVGRVVSSVAGARQLPFVVPLKPFARRALLQRRHLAVIVETVVTPPSGQPTTIARRVKLSA